VANYGARTPGSSISVIDLQERTEKRVDIAPLQRPHGIAVSRDGKVYFTAEGNKVVARLDPATGKVDQQYATGQNGTHMVLFSRDGSRMFAANIGSDTVSVLTPGAEAKTIATGKGPEGMDGSVSGWPSVMGREFARRLRLDHRHFQERSYRNDRYRTSVPIGSSLRMTASWLSCRTWNPVNWLLSMFHPGR